jgi:CheY-like chemotaxis protein
VTTPALLLVDDEPVMAVIVGRFCRGAGWSLAACPDAASAWDRLGAGRPDLVLLDLNLPGEGGAQLCRRLRADPRGAGLAVALFSQPGLPEVAAGLEAGADFLVSKELVGRPNQWQARVAEILAATRGRAPSAPLPWAGGGTSPVPTPGWLDGLSRALRHPSLRPLGPDVLRWLVGRAALALPPPTAALVEARLLSTGGAAPPLGPEAAPALAGTLAELSWRLLGGEASVAFRQAVAAAVPGPWESPAL